MSLKIRGSEKKPYSKSSCPRIIFPNQLNISGITLNNAEDRRKSSHSTPYLAFVELTNPTL